VYRKACKALVDQQLKDGGRTIGVVESSDELSEFCVERCGAIHGEMDGDLSDCRKSDWGLANGKKKGRRCLSLF
jgi:hypothetical protein